MATGARAFVQPLNYKNRYRPEKKSSISLFLTELYLQNHLDEIHYEKFLC